ncbi:prepilin-type N-terminal cleavage/methylation domain-containing protein [Pseudoduganella sp. FT55W]|uniref:Type II secretion system protein H n=1 Tax=Duganella rivi TaxID=2666083 RepID=A0A7X4KDH1_9BURK|nr:GspH/FimT family pseudopilin [Duganella rivi]MYM69220.1 prepilin-type N-terminal cleavage/methylation domain-containing protein [Duganella rivi]
MRRERGFTLIELLVVMVILGIILGLVSLNALPGQKQSMQQDAKRIALLLQLARDEAIVRNRQIAFEAGPENYRFMIRNDNKQWEQVVNDDLLREREFKNAPVTLLLDPAPPLPEPTLRIIFGREPVDKPFVLNMVSSDGASIAIRADGIGHFTVD